MGPLLVDIQGPILTIEEKHFLDHSSVGGVILFTRNYETPTQLSQLTTSIRTINPDLLITVDQEGGYVQRFKTEGFTRLPAMYELGKLYIINPQHARQAAIACGWIMAQELLSCGIDLSFAPVLDIHSDASQIIGKYQRAFSDNVNIITELAEHLIQGMHNAGMKAVVKHYPGHGSVVGDTHENITIDERSFESITHDMEPFARLHQTYDAVMMAHVIYPAVDNQLASCSKIWLQLLREQTGFIGVTFSDALNMHAATTLGDYPSRVRAVLDAGIDIPIICGSHEEIEFVLNTVKIDNQVDYRQKLVKLRGQLFQWHNVVELQQASPWRHYSDTLTTMKDYLNESDR